MKFILYIKRQVCIKFPLKFWLKKGIKKFGEILENHIVLVGLR